MNTEMNTCQNVQCVIYICIYLYNEGRDVRENHKDYNQILLDVRRSMKRFPKGKEIS